MCGGGPGGLIGAALGIATGGFGMGLGALAGGALGGAAGAGLTGGNVFQGALGGVGIGAGVDIVGPMLGGNFAGLGGQAAAPIIEAGFPTAGPTTLPILGNPGGLSGIGSSLNLATGAYGLFQAQQLQQLAAQRAAMLDPYAAYRSGAAAQLQSLQANPSSITNTPGYQTGLEATQRTMAAQGYQGSGNMAAAVAKYGGDFYQQQLNNLAMLSGASNAYAPGQGADIALTGMVGATAETTNALQLLAKGLR